MAGKYKETDYMYGSARVRALEGLLVGRERLEHMLEAKSSSDILASLPDYGFELIYDREGESESLRREDSLLSVLSKGYEELDRMTQESGFTDFLRYSYDANNIKSVIKCFSRGISPDGMLFESLGTVSVPMLKEAFEKKEYGMFPAAMAKAIPEAEESFAKTGNPQQVDLIIDRACYADMLSAAKRLNVPYAVRLVESRIDLTNLLICVRLIRMKLGAAAIPFFKETALEGGSLELSALEEAIGTGEGRLAEYLAYTKYSALSPTLESAGSLSVLEKQSDDLWMSMAKEAKYVPFGAEVLLGYAVALEYEIKNIRIILAGKDARLASEEIRERLRESYV